MESTDTNCDFYNNAKTYWSTVDSTVNGMLGGFGCISHTDIQGSRIFLQKILKSRKLSGNLRALDCGAGIGRVSQNLLIKIFKEVDLVEQNSKFSEEAEKRLSGEPHMGKIYTIGLQDFVPNPNRLYHVIWCQWVLGHLTDEHLIKFLQRCRQALAPNGVICIKENITTSTETSVIDETDSSFTRPLNVFLDIFKIAGYNVLRQSTQTNFPKGLYAVRLFALAPKID